MPQTSPMNWMILSLSMITSILYILSSNNDKTVNMTSTSSKINLNTKSWNW